MEPVSELKPGCPLTPGMIVLWDAMHDQPAYLSDNDDETRTRRFIPVFSDMDKAETALEWLPLLVPLRAKQIDDPIDFLASVWVDLTIEVILDIRQTPERKVRFTLVQRPEV